MITILFLAADPIDAPRLRLGEELREIKKELRLANLRNEFTVEEQHAVCPADISRALCEFEPQIVHFSGHGTEGGALCIEDATGKTLPVEAKDLAALFEQFSSHVRCVILNACYSEAQARAIGEHVEYVIGIDQAISDKAAIAFSTGFYQALGAGRSISEAYKLGCAQVRLQGIPQNLLPTLVTGEAPASRMIEGERIDTIEDLYERLCTARSQCKSFIRLMQIREIPPAFVSNGKVVLDGELPKLRVNSPLAAKWYNGFPDWIAKPGRQVERITVGYGDSLVYARFVDDQMKRAGGIWETLLLKEKMAGLPAYNLCIFDENELTLTYGVAYALSGQSIWICNQRIVRFFLDIYSQIRSPLFSIPLHEFEQNT
jgi:hypothetical protein